MMQMMENAFTAMIGLPREDRAQVEGFLRMLEDNDQGARRFVAKVPGDDLWIARVGADLRIIFKWIDGGVEVLDVLRHQPQKA